MLKNHAGTKETDAGGHLCGHARRVTAAAACHGQFADQHEQGGTKCHQRIGTNAGAAGAQLAFEPYQCAQCRAKHNAYEAVEHNGKGNCGEHKIHLLKSRRQELPAHPTAGIRCPQLRWEG